MRCTVCLCLYMAFTVCDTAFSLSFSLLHNFPRRTQGGTKFMARHDGPTPVHTPGQITITLPCTVLVHWSPGNRRAPGLSTVVAVVAPQSCVAPLSPLMRPCLRSCGPPGTGMMVYYMADTHPLFCVPGVRLQLDPWSPACPALGGDVPEKSSYVCQ